LLVQTNDSTFPSGVCGVGYTMHFNSYPAGRGAYFDNFVADTLDVTTPRFVGMNQQPDGTMHMGCQAKWLPLKPRCFHLLSSLLDTPNCPGITTVLSRRGHGGDTEGKKGGAGGSQK
jgi:hypothetical protein